MADIRGLATGALAIDAPPARVYSIIADYRQYQPRIVPPEYFKGIQVEERGIGAGTRIIVTDARNGNVHNCTAHRQRAGTRASAG